MKSIGFLEELQRQVVARHKTETRRLTDPQPDDYLLNPRGDFILPDGSRADLLARRRLVRPRYKVGEVIYIKEPYVDDIDPDRVFYKYDPVDIQALMNLGYGECLDKPGFWRNKQSMSARMARYFLRIIPARFTAPRCRSGLPRTAGTTFTDSTYPIARFTTYRALPEPAAYSAGSAHTSEGGGAFTYCTLYIRNSTKWQ